MNKSCDIDCKSQHVIACNSSCVKFRNLTIVGHRKRIKHDVIAFSPILFMMEIFSAVIPIIVILISLFMINQRFSAFALCFPNLSTNLKENKWYHYCPLVILSLPVNILFGITLIYLVPLKMIYFQFKPLLQDPPRKCYLLKEIKTCQISVTRITLDTLSLSYLIVHAVFKAIRYQYKLINYQSYITDPYKLWTSALEFLITPIVLTVVLKLSGNINLILLPLTRAIQLVTPLWGYADTILDILQTKKYYDLSKNTILDNQISIRYFYVSITSFIAPVVFTLLVQIQNRTFQTQFDRLFGNIINKLSINGPKKKTIIRVMLLVMLFAPVQIVLAMINYYITIPFGLLREGINKLRYGEDENRSLKLILFTNKIPVTNLPLYAGLEPLGEALIQTFLSLTFLINH